MSMTYDPSRDQNSLGGPTPSFPSPESGLNGGPSGGPSSPILGPVTQSMGAGPSTNGAGTGTPPVNTTPTIDRSGFANTSPTPAPATPAPPAAGSDLGAGDMAYANTQGHAGTNERAGSFNISPGGDSGPAPTPGGNTPAGPDGGFNPVNPGVGTVPGAGAPGPISGVQMFADGGEVQDDGDQDDTGADPQGAMGNDPMTQLISAAMDSVDKAFAFGRQKNGLMGTGGVGAPQGQQRQQAPAQPPQAQDQGNNQDGQPDEAPGDQANTDPNDDGDQDDQGS